MNVINKMSKTQVLNAMVKVAKLHARLIEKLAKSNEIADYLFDMWTHSSKKTIDECNSVSQKLYNAATIISRIANLPTVDARKGSKWDSGGYPQAKSPLNNEQAKVAFRFELVKELASNVDEKFVQSILQSLKKSGI